MTRDRSNLRTSVVLLAAYCCVALSFAMWRAARGDGSWAIVAGYVVLLAATIATARAGHGGAAVLRDWLPLLALPALYAGIPVTAATTTMFDAPIQQADRILFGADAARALAGAMPYRWLSEILHAAYLSYYVIIYLPPLLMYVRGDEQAFRTMVAGFTMAMVGCFVAFCVFPVEGPRYAWPPPAGVPEGPVRAVVLEILASGSSRGTAFPSSHQAIALVLSLSSMQWDRRLGWPLLVATGLLGVGAVYGGFHYATDMLAGAAVGIVAWAVTRRRGRPGKVALG